MPVGEVAGVGDDNSRRRHRAGGDHVEAMLELAPTVELARAAGDHPEIVQLERLGGAFDERGLFAGRVDCGDPELGVGQRQHQRREARAAADVGDFEPFGRQFREKFADRERVGDVLDGVLLRLHDPGEIGDLIGFDQELPQFFAAPGESLRRGDLAFGGENGEIETHCAPPRPRTAPASNATPSKAK